MRLSWISYTAILLFSAMTTLALLMRSMFPESFFSVNMNLNLLAIPIVLFLLVSLGILLCKMAIQGGKDAAPWWVYLVTVIIAMLFLVVNSLNSIYFRFQHILFPMDNLTRLQFTLFFTIPFGFIVGLALELFKRSWKGRRINLAPGLILVVLFTAISITYKILSFPSHVSMITQLVLFAPAIIGIVHVISRAGKDKTRFAYYIFCAGMLATLVASSILLTPSEVGMIDYKLLVVSFFFMVTLLTVGTDVQIGVIDNIREEH